MKKTVISIATSFVLLSSVSYSIPVIDAPQLAENFQTIERWLEQGKQWIKEAKRWKKDYAAITGFRLDGDILAKFTELNTMLDTYGLDMGDLDLDNPKSQIGVYAKQLFDSFKLFDDCNYDFMTADQTRICEDTTKREVQEIATVAKFSDEVTSVLEKLNKLNDKLENSEDTKTTQDVEAGIESTVATLELLSTKYEMMSMRNEAKEAVDKRQKKQIYMKKFEHDNLVKHNTKSVL